MLDKNFLKTPTREIIKGMFEINLETQKFEISGIGRIF